jgi:hypothetical protein
MKQMTIGELHAALGDLIASGYEYLPVLIPSHDGNMQTASTFALSTAAHIRNTGSGRGIYERSPFIDAGKPKTGLQLY